MPDPQVEALLQMVADLEARLNSVTEQLVIGVVQRELQTKRMFCKPDECPWGWTDPVLRVFRGAYGLVDHELENGEWSAVREPLEMRWRVESVTWYGDGTTPRTTPVGRTFYVYEETGLVEGVRPSEPSEPEEEFWARITAGEREREAAFRFRARELYPQANVLVADVLEKQAPLYSDIFAMQRGLGDIGPGTSFRDFLQGLGQNIGRPDPGFYRGLVERAAGVVGREPAALTPAQLEFQRELEEDPERQFALYSRAALAGVPMEFSEPFTSEARETFKMATDIFNLQTQLGGQAVHPFVAFVGGDFRVPAMPRAAYKSTLEDIANLLEGTTPSLTPEAVRLAEELRARPSRQFDLVYQQYVQGVDRRFRPGLEPYARRDWEDWLIRTQGKEEFLPASVRAGNFFGPMSYGE